MGVSYFCRYGFCFLGFVVLFWQHLYNSIQDVVDGVTLTEPARGKNTPKNDPTTSKPNYNRTAHLNGIKVIPRAPSLGDQGDCTSESHKSPITE